MNFKLVIVAALMLFRAFGLNAEDWIVKNHMPLSITVHYKMGPLGEDKLVTIDPHSQYALHVAEGDGLKAIQISAIKAFEGENYFGGNNSVSILKEDFSSLGAYGKLMWGAVWDVFIQLDRDQQGSGLPLLITPTKVRFLLVRGNVPLRSGGFVDTSPWYDAKTGGLATISPEKPQK